MDPLALANKVYIPSFSIGVATLQHVNSCGAQGALRGPADRSVSRSYQPFDPMHMNIFVSRLSPAVTDLHLELLFGYFGTVERATVVRDRGTGASKLFGFVEMPDATAAREAISKLNGAPLEGAKLVVKVAEDRPE